MRRRRRRGDPVRLYLEHLAPAGRGAQASAIALIRKLVAKGHGEAAKFPGWGRLVYRDAAYVRAALIQQGRAPATIRRTLAALRGVAREAWRLGILSTDTYHRLASVEGVSGRGLAKGRVLRTDEVEALFGACSNDKTSVGARDAAAIALMYAAGLRREEAAALQLDQVDRTTGALSLTETKRHEARVVHLAGGLPVVEEWLEVRGLDPGPLLWRGLPAGGVMPKRVTADALYRLVERRAREAGLERVTPHDLRRTHITMLLDREVDVLLIGRMVGHKRADTTRIYDRRGEAAARRAAGLLPVPVTRVRRAIRAMVRNGGG